MALLVGKYDHNSTLSTGNVREQLDTLVDELFERIVLCGLIDPPTVHMSCFMYNVDTQEFEQYPPNWWHQVVEVRSYLGMCGCHAVGLQAHLRVVIHIFGTQQLCVASSSMHVACIQHLMLRPCSVGSGRQL